MVSKSVIIQEFQDLNDKLEKDIAILEAQDKKKEAGTLKYKIRTFQKVIQSLKHCHLTDIKSSSDVKHLPGIGKGTQARIDEIINQGGKLKEAHKKFDPKDLKIIQDIQDLESVTGIGPSHAAHFRKDGITLKLLQNEYSSYNNNTLKMEETLGLQKLTHHQMIGLKYYDEFSKRIPRREIDHVRMTIQSLIEKYQKTKKIQIEGKICGSYRRGCKDSGDIDLLMTGDSKFDLVNFVHFLTDEKFLIDHLTEKGTTKYMGVSSGKHRLDIRFVPRESWGAALMYFTGSKTFNTLVRAKALELGYTLEEYGVYPLLDPKKDQDKLKDRKKHSHSHQHLKGDRIDCPTEEKVFQLLGINDKYLEAHYRDLSEKVTKL